MCKRVGFHENNLTPEAPPLCAASRNPEKLEKGKFPRAGNLQLPQVTECTKTLSAGAGSPRRAQPAEQHPEIGHPRAEVGRERREEAP